MSTPPPADGSSPPRRVRIIIHPGRAEALRVAADTVRLLSDCGVHTVVSSDAATGLRRGTPDLPLRVDDSDQTDDCELVIVFGGDGTILRGAELARPTATPVLGVNLGHVGFLAEAEPDDLEAMVDAVVHSRYYVEERLTIDLTVIRGGTVVDCQWALNDASVEKASRARMLELMVEIDGRPLSRWGGDGVVAATPTGSTAYAFSAGGPIVWPQVAALLLVPISAHALFARPLVVSPDSVLAIELDQLPQHGVLWCDGRRRVDLLPGDRVQVTRGARPVRLARLHTAPFTDRLVNKFHLPVHGWRGVRAERDRAAETAAAESSPEPS
jgi:NAD+ kinase